MNGAESLIRTAIAAGVEVCFANPGTTEMPLVAALESRVVSLPEATWRAMTDRRCEGSRW